MPPRPSTLPDWVWPGCAVVERRTQRVYHIMRIEAQPSSALRVHLVPYQGQTLGELVDVLRGQTLGTLVDVLLDIPELLLLYQPVPDPENPLPTSSLGPQTRLSAEEITLFLGAPTEGHVAVPLVAGSGITTPPVTHGWVPVHTETAYISTGTSASPPDFWFDAMQRLYVRCPDGTVQEVFTQAADEPLRNMPTAPRSNPAETRAPSALTAWDHLRNESEEDRG